MARRAHNRDGLSGCLEIGQTNCVTSFTQPTVDRASDAHRSGPDGDALIEISWLARSERKPGRRLAQRPSAAAQLVAAAQQPKVAAAAAPAPARPGFAAPEARRDRHSCCLSPWFQAPTSLPGLVCLTRRNSLSP